MKKLRKVVIFILAILILYGGYLYFFLPIRVYEPEKYSSRGKDSLTRVLEEDEVKEDVSQLIDIIEETHPIFLEGRNENYEKAKANFVDNINKTMTTAQFQLEVSKYLSSLKDGHTRISWNEGKLLDISWVYLDGKLMLLDENDKLTDKEIVKINDMDIDYLIKGVNEIFPAENYSAEKVNIDSLKDIGVLTSLGVKDENEASLTIKNNQGYETVKAEYMEDVGSSYYDPNIFSRKIDNETFYIYLGFCEINDQYNTMMKKLKSALDQGITNVIIDVRNNPGGTAEVSTGLLDALDMEYGRFGDVVRFSPLAQKYRGYLRSSGKVIYKSRNDSKRNEDIELYVLTNENTYSSATWLAILVQDGKLGTIVGTASGNSPSSYGDIIHFQLSNSKIEGTVSHKKHTRPDYSKDEEKALEPDIKVDFGEDALERTLELINEK